MTLTFNETRSLLQWKLDGWIYCGSEIKVGFMTLILAYIELFIRGKIPGEMFGYLFYYIYKVLTMLSNTSNSSISSTILGQTAYRVVFACECIASWLCKPRVGNPIPRFD